MIYKHEPVISQKICDGFRCECAVWDVGGFVRNRNLRSWLAATSGFLQTQLLPYAMESFQNPFREQIIRFAINMPTKLGTFSA